ncbi:MAG: hypothetical protein V8R10_00735 [Christensenellales bacterium]
MNSSACASSDSSFPMARGDDRYQCPYCLSLFDVDDSFQADEVRVTVDKKCYTFAVKPAITDYDGCTWQDYTLVLSRRDDYPLLLMALASKAINACPTFPVD